MAWNGLMQLLKVLLRLIGQLFRLGPEGYDNAVFKERWMNNLSPRVFRKIRDRRQILRQILSQSKRIDQLLFPLKSSESPWFSDDFRGNRSWLIHSSLTVLNLQFSQK